MIRVLPIVFVTDMAASIRFYGALGFACETEARSGKWAELAGPDSRLALHLAEPPLPEPVQRVRLNFEATEKLEDIVARCRNEGVEPLGEIVDEAWGRKALFLDPDGLECEVHEHDRSLYQ